MIVQLPGVSEDCLTLNVFRPAGISKDAQLPVAVWIYGGGFVFGETTVFNATGIIVRSVVRVSRAFAELRERMLTI